MSKEFKPHLACDIDYSKIDWSKGWIVMPKIDGCRALNIDGKLVGRSKKAFKNPYLTEKFSKEYLTGMDGELALGDWTDARLCSITTGAVNRQKDDPKEGKYVADAVNVDWWLFDCLAPGVIDLPYIERLGVLYLRVHQINLSYVKAVPWKLVHSFEEYEALDNQFLEEGFEGTILRDPNGMHKSGRASTTSNAYLRDKKFVDFEGIVVGLEEAMENTNEAKVNELGRTERSTHQENLVPKGMVGTILMELLKDVEFMGKIILKKGDIIRSGPGKMTHEERKYYWENPQEIIGYIGKAKFFPRGLKDKLRFCTWISFRAKEDMSE
jgi:DNA ligase-1